MKGSLIGAGLCALLASGCGQRVVDTPAEDDSSGSASGTSMGGTSTTTGTGDDVGETDEVTTEAESNTDFVPDVDGGSNPCGQLCDIWNQDDCPEGEKCTAVACEVGSPVWDSNVCREIQGTAEPGDPCMYTDGSPLSGNDTCAKGSMCWDVDPDTGFGTCVAFCQGTPDSPDCGPESYCTISGDGVLTICLPTCDPLNSDCEEGELCLPLWSSEGYGCVLDASGGMAPYGTPCNYLNVCNDGLMCVDASAVPEPSCEGESGCCSPYCDLTLPNTCPGEGQECQPVFDPQPAGYEHVGICLLPL